jgi:hypothetical protein
MNWKAGLEYGQRLHDHPVELQQLQGKARVFRFSSVAVVALLLCAADASAQSQKVQWTDMVYVPGRWLAGQVVAPAGKDTLALVMRIDYFAREPRWRMEIRRTSNGATFGEPVTIFGDKQKALVVTPLGTTPLDKHALGKDTLVRAAPVFDQKGNRTGAANGVIKDAKRVAFRRTARTATFDNADLDPSKQSASRQFISRNLVAVGNQRSAAVVATAGARGVDKVRTPAGELAVTPDPAAVTRMERTAVGAVRLEDFLRGGKLGPYKAAS